MRNKILITGLLCLGLLSCNLFVLDKAQATVSTTTNKVLYSGDGFSTSFAFSFNIFAKTDLVVQVNDTLGVVHTLTLNTDYTISTTTFPNSGNVILSAGGGWPVIPIGDTLLILRQLPFKQLINITDYSATPAATWNQAFDRACMLEQQLQEQINRTIIASPFSSSITFPAPVANDLIGWDSTGSILINYIPNTSAYITFPLPVVEGGTGASTASGARTNLGSAASGANSDITSLSGITTALSTAQGGTGSTANANAASGVVVLDQNRALINVGFINRGDPSSVDLTNTGMTIDGNLHAWDMSSIVPAGAKAVLLIVAAANTTAGESLAFQNNADTNFYNQHTMGMQVGGAAVYQDIIVACDSGRKIKYLATNGHTWSSITILIAGWWI